MSITTHVQALTTALNAIDNHLAGMLGDDHGVTPDQLCFVNFLSAERARKNLPLQQ